LVGLLTEARLANYRQSGLTADETERTALVVEGDFIGRLVDKLESGTDLAKLFAASEAAKSDTSTGGAGNRKGRVKGSKNKPKAPENEVTPVIVAPDNSPEVFTVEQAAAASDAEQDAVAANRPPADF
jgi:hypothetical protein